MKQMKATQIVIGLGAALAAALSAPTANADAQGYIDQLQRDGVPMLSGTVPAVQAGMTACSMIRDGMGPGAGCFSSRGTLVGDCRSQDY